MTVDMCLRVVRSTFESSRIRSVRFYGSHLRLRCVRQLVVKNTSRNHATDKSSLDKSSNSSNINVKESKRIFSGIQPTGSLHLGNYFGAVKQWVEMQNESNDLFISVVDLHSITMPHDPQELRNNILKMTACLLACGIDIEKCTFFQQSMISQHVELAWILSSLTTMARLGRLPQYKEKSAGLKEIPLGLFVYPVLQSADILLYKATHVPVGEDQLQHIQVAQDLAKVFNNKYSIDMFPSPKAVTVGSEHGSRLKSLRNPAKKMSKSDIDARSRIELTDSPDTVAEKLKKAVTDFTSAITYDPIARPGVANLIHIHCLLTGESPQQVCDEASNLDTSGYKLKLADIINQTLLPTRIKIIDLLANRDYLENSLKLGAHKARTIAEETWSDVKKVVGLSIP